MSIVDQAFFWLLRWSIISFALLTVGSFVCWRCGRAIERLRAVQATFLALAVAFALQWIPGLPRWNLGWLAVDTHDADQQIASNLVIPAVGHAGMAEREPSRRLGNVNSQRIDAAATMMHEHANPASAAELFPEATPSADQNLASATAAGESTPPRSGSFHWLVAMQLVLFIAFMAGAVAGIVSFGLSAWRLRRLRNSSRPAMAEIVKLLESLLPTTHRPIDIRISSEIAVPITFGLWQPVIVLPDSMIGGENTSMLRYCLAHEGSHIFQYDVAQWWVVQFLQPIVWFQPLYRFLRGEMRICQDQLADCFATEAASDPMAYAELLVQLAKQHCFPCNSAAMTMINGQSKLARRVLSLLDENRKVSTICRRPVVVGFSVALSLLSLSLSTLDLRRARAESPPQAENQSGNTSRSDPPKSPNAQSISAPIAPQNDASAVKTTANSHLDFDGDPLPPGVIARLGTKRFRPGRFVIGNDPSFFSFLGDKQVLIQVNGEGWLRHWDAQSGRMLKQMRLTEERLSLAAASADCHVLAVGGCTADFARNVNVNWFKLIDPATGKESLTWQEDGAQAEKIAVSPDGKLVAWGAGTAVHLFDVELRKKIASLGIGDTGKPNSLNFMPNGKVLGIGSVGKLILWDWNSKSEPTFLSILDNNLRRQTFVDCVSFSPDGTKVAIGHRDAAGVSLFDVATGQILQSFSLLDVDSWLLRQIAFSPDGKLLAVPIYTLAGKEGIALWDVITGKLIDRLKGLNGTATNVGFSSDGRLLSAYSGFDGTMCVWDIETRKAFGADLPGHVIPPSSLKFINHDQQLVSASDDGTVRIWNVDDSRELRVIQPQSDATGLNRGLRAIDVSPDGKFIAASRLDGSLRTWELETGKEVRRFLGHGNLGGARAVRFSPDGSRLVSWGDDGQLLLADVQDGKTLNDYDTLGDDRKRLEVPPRHSAQNAVIVRSMYGAALSSDASILMMPLLPPDPTKQTGIRLLSTANGHEISRITQEETGTTHWALSPDAKYALAVTWGRSQLVPFQNAAVKLVKPATYPIVLYDVADSKIIAHHEGEGSGAQQISFSADGKFVAMAEFDESWHVALRTLPDMVDAGRIDLPSRPNGVEFSAAAKQLATSVADGTILVWDLEHLPTRKK